MPANIVEIVFRGKNEAKGTIKSIDKGLTQVSKTATIAAAAIAGLGTGVTLAAASVEKGVTEIATLMDGVTETAIREMKEELLDLSIASGQALDVLTKARYDIVSAGFRDASESARVLEQSVKLATAGVTTAASAADILTTALNAYGFGAEEAGRVSDVLFQTVKFGKTTMDELSGSLGIVFPMARAAGVAIEEVGAAMATMTSAGIKTQVATIALQNVIQAMAAPTSQAGVAMKELGIRTRGLDGNMLSLVTVVRQFEGLNLAAVKELVPNIRAARGLLAMANNVDTLRESMIGMNTAAGATNTAYELMADTMDFRISQAIQGAKVAFAEFGETVFPIAEELLKGFERVLPKIREVINLLTTEGQTHVRIGTIIQQRQRLQQDLIKAEETIASILEKQEDLDARGLARRGRRKVLETQMTIAIAEQGIAQRTIVSLTKEEEQLLIMLNGGRDEAVRLERERVLEMERLIELQRIEEEQQQVIIDSLNAADEAQKRINESITANQEAWLLTQGVIENVKLEAEGYITTALDGAIVIGEFYVSTWDKIGLAMISAAEIGGNALGRSLDMFVRTGAISLSKFIKDIERGLLRLAANKFFLMLAGGGTGFLGTLATGIANVFGSTGGPVKGFQGGGAATVPGRGTGDQVPAMLEAGEVIVNKDMVKAAMRGARGPSEGGGGIPWVMLDGRTLTRAAGQLALARVVQPALDEYGRSG